MNWTGFQEKYFALLLIFFVIGTAQGLVCYKCNSLGDDEKTSCLNVVNVGNETCYKDEQCYMALYNMVEIVGLRGTKTNNVLIRNCGPIKRGCEGEAAAQDNSRSGHRVTQVPGSCYACNTDNCNAAQSVNPFWGLLLCGLFLLNKVM